MSVRRPANKGRTSSDQDAILKDDVVKIGYSAGNTARRLYDVGTGCPFALELYASLPGDKAREKEIHGLFAKDRIRKEWFWWTEELADWIDEQEIEQEQTQQTGGSEGVRN